MRLISRVRVRHLTGSDEGQNVSALDAQVFFDKNRPHRVTLLREEEQVERLFGGAAGREPAQFSELNEPLVRLFKIGVLNTNGLQLLNLPLTISGINEPTVVY